jgi:hypothetical protein
MAAYGTLENHNIVLQRLNCLRVNNSIIFYSNLCVLYHVALMDESRVNNFQRRQLTSHMLRK